MAGSRESGWLNALRADGRCTRHDDDANTLSTTVRQSISQLQKYKATH